MMEECMKNADDRSRPAVFHPVPHKASEIFHFEVLFFTQKLCGNGEQQQ